MNKLSEAKYGEAVRAIKIAILQSQYRAAKLVNREHWFCIMVLAVIFLKILVRNIGGQGLLHLSVIDCRWSCLGSGAFRNVI